MRSFTFFLLLLFLSSSVFAQDKVIPVVVDGDEVVYSKEDEKVVAKGNVVMKYEGMTLECDEAVYDVTENVAYIEGNVRLISDKGIVKGRRATYDFATQTANIYDIRMESPPFYGGSYKGRRISANKYELRSGFITTCDSEVPHYRLVSNRITIYPGEKVVAKNMLLKIGRTPVFYIPYYSHSLKDQSFPVELAPGKSDDFGFNVLSRWRYRFNEENRGKVYFDWYEKRGIGTGFTHKVESDSIDGEGLFNYYFIEDDLHKIENREELFDLYSERSSVASKYLEDDRYKFQFSYNGKPAPNLSIVSEINKFSDTYFMKDFFYREYEIDASPSSYLLADYAFSNSSLSFLAQKRVNHFFEETEYLPKLEYNFYRQNIGDSPFYFESKDFISNTTKKFINSDTDYDSGRFYSHNILSYQKKIAWLHISPYVGMYSIFYSKNDIGDENVWRQAPENGVSLNTKLYKYFTKGFSFWGEDVEIMRHVITPSITYSYIHEPTVSNDNIFQFDEFDDLQRKDSLVFKLENKLQSKNQKRTWDFLYFAPSIEYKINEEGKGSYFDDLTADLEFYPIEGFSLTADSSYDVPTRRFGTFNMDMKISDTKEDKYSVSLGHRYVRTDSSQGTLEWTYRLTPKMQLRNYLRYEYNTGDFKEQQYNIRLDLHCWWMDIGLDVDKQREGVKDFAFRIMFTLKAFPEKVHFGFHKTYNGAREDY